MAPAIRARCERHEIPVAGRIVAVADTFDAITNDRPYRAARPVSVALRDPARARRAATTKPRLIDALEQIVADPGYEAASRVAANCA